MDPAQHVEALYEFVSSQALLSNAHTVGFFTEDHWNNVIPDNWKSDLLVLEHDSTSWATEPSVKNGDLWAFLKRAHELKLQQDTIGTSSSHDNSRLARFSMTAKKSHEVKKMSDYVTGMAHQLQTRQVVDVGSGKGYLSEHLSVEYGLVVVGVDSEHSNTTGAIERCRKVEKASRGRVDQSSFSAAQLPSSSTHELALCSISTLFTEDGVDETVYSELESAESGTKTTEASNCITAHTASASIPLTQPLKKSFSAITDRVSPQVPLMSLAEQASGGLFRADTPTVLVGLHTCGDLACSALRLFAANTNLKGLCIVGCCYHFITENITQRDACEAGFPMSKLLKRRGAYLGRTARMLACQTEARFSETTTGSSLQSVYYRAVLQVILEKEFNVVRKSGDSFQNLTVGRIKKYDNFLDYVRKALKKLNLSSDCITEEKITEYEMANRPGKILLQRLVQLRAVLAPAIESLIIMDRLMYLLELTEPSDAPPGGCVQSAWLVRLFSPTISPRCYAVCALKH